MRGGGVGDEIYVGDVGGKRREILLDGLRVANVGEDGVADGKVGALGGDGDSGLSHEGEQAHGFERDGFAAGVGSADDELALGAIHLKGERDNRAATRAQVALHDGMAGIDEDKRVCAVVGEKFDAGALILLSEAGLGELQLEFAEDFDGGEDGLGLLAEAGRHFEEDAMDFALLVFEEANEFVVLLDGFEGLDENGLTGGAGSVDDALNTALLLGFDGDDETVATDGDQLVLKRIALREAAEIAAKRVLDAAALLFNFAPDAAESRRGVVVEGAVGRELVGEVAQERREVFDGGGEFFDGGPRLA